MRYPSPLITFNLPSASELAAEALAGGAGELHVDGAVGQPFMAVALGDFAGQHRARGAVGVLIAVTIRTGAPRSSAARASAISLRSRMVWIL